MPSLCANPSRSLMPSLPPSLCVGSFLADSAENSVAFTLADATKAINIDLEKGEGTGVTVVTNTAGVGVVVTAVVPGRAAARSGLEVGHVVVSMDGILARDHKHEDVLALLRGVEEEHGRRMSTTAQAVRGSI